MFNLNGCKICNSVKYRLVHHRVLKSENIKRTSRFDIWLKICYCQKCSLKIQIKLLTLFRKLYETDIITEKFVRLMQSKKYFRHTKTNIIAPATPGFNTTSKSCF